MSSSVPTTLPPADRPCGSPFEAEPLPGSTVHRLRQTLRRRARRRERYGWAVPLRDQGYGNRAIARITGVSRSVMDDWMRSEGFPQRTTVPGPFTPYVEYVQQRLDTPDITVRQIDDELVEQGFKGAHGAVYRLATDLRLGHLPPAVQDQRPALAPSPSTTMGRRSSPGEGAWLSMRAAEEPGGRDRARLATLYEKLEGSRAVQELVQTFTTLPCARPKDAVEPFDAWLGRVATSGVVEFVRFGRGLQQDDAAVVMAMTSSWRNGQTEGQVNRLKMIERQMFGRARFDVPRARVLLNS